MLFGVLHRLRYSSHGLKYLPHGAAYFLYTTRLAIGQAEPWWHSTLYELLYLALITVVVILLVGWILEVTKPAKSRAFLLYLLVYTAVLWAAPWWVGLQLLAYLKKLIWPSPFTWHEWKLKYLPFIYLSRKKWIFWGPEDSWEHPNPWGITEDEAETESEKTQGSPVDSNEPGTRESEPQDGELPKDNLIDMGTREQIPQEIDTLENASSETGIPDDTREVSVQGISQTTALDEAKEEIQYIGIDTSETNVVDADIEEISSLQDLSEQNNRTKPGSKSPGPWPEEDPWRLPTWWSPEPRDNVDDTEHDSESSKCPFCRKENCSCGTCARCQDTVSQCSCPPCEWCPWKAEYCRCRFCYACGGKGSDCQCEYCSECYEHRANCKCVFCFVCGENTRQDCRCYNCFRCYKKPGECRCIFNPFAHFVGPGSAMIQWWTDDDLIRMSGNDWGGHTLITYGQPKLVIAVADPCDVISYLLHPFTQRFYRAKSLIRKYYRQMRVWFKIYTYTDQVEEDSFWNVYQRRWVKKMMDDLSSTLRDQSPESPPVIAFDLEAVNLGRSGITCYMQTRDFVREQTYLIDLCRLGRWAFDLPGRDGLTLRMVLEDKNVKKLIFDGRQDSDALYAHYGVQARGVVDLQIMQMLTGYSPPDRRPSLLNVIRYDSGLTDLERNDFDSRKGYEFNGDYTVFMQRPLPARLKAYATNDVAYLRRTYDYNRALLTTVGMERAYEWSDRQVEETWATDWVSNRASVDSAFRFCWSEPINPGVKTALQKGIDLTASESSSTELPF